MANLPYKVVQNPTIRVLLNDSPLSPPPIIQTSIRSEVNSRDYSIVIERLLTIKKNYPNHDT
mgnify:CR=1 FL=1